MQDYLDQVDAASAKTGIYFVTLGAALAIPDMCAALESDDGRATGARYVAWFDRWVPDGPMTGENCYGYRCSFVHQARNRPHRGAHRRVMFIEPGNQTGVIHNVVIEDILMIDVERFIAEIVGAARRWLVEAKATENYKRNRSASFRRWPAGVPGYVMGTPVIT